MESTTSRFWKRLLGRKLAYIAIVFCASAGLSWAVWQHYAHFVAGPIDVNYYTDGNDPTYLFLCRDLPAAMGAMLLLLTFWPFYRSLDGEQGETKATMLAGYGCILIVIAGVLRGCTGMIAFFD